MIAESDCPLSLLSGELLLATAAQRQQTLLVHTEALRQCFVTERHISTTWQGFTQRAACLVRWLAAKTKLPPVNRWEPLQRHPNTSACCRKRLFHSQFFLSEGQDLNPWCWPLCSAAENSKYLSPELVVLLLNRFQCTGSTEIGSQLLNGSSAPSLTLLLNADSMGIKKYNK